jgi:hypothetical protein
VLGRGLGAVIGAVEISLNNLAVVVKGAVNHGALGPRDTGIGDKDVEAAIEVLDGFVDGLFNSLGVPNIELVSLAWSE